MNKGKSSNVDKNSSGSKKTCALVFTDNYPFGTGEEFFEQEISYWSRQFTQIIIVPMRIRAGDAAQTRVLPDNAIVRTMPSSTSGDWRLWAVRWAPQILLGKQRIVRQNPLTDPVKFAVDVRFAAITYETYARVIEALNGIDFKQFDSVLVYSYWFFTGVAVARLLKGGLLQGIPTKIIARAHAYDVDEADSPRGYIGSRPFLLESVDEVYPISDYAAQFLNNYDPTKGKVSVRRLGVPKAVRTSRSRGETLRLVSCSHMADYKRVDLIADAVAVLQQRGIAVKWTHIGESDQSRLERMKQHIQRHLPDPDAVELLGHMSNEAVREMYAQNDYAVFLNCSSGEGVPVSVMEAQAAGLPVIATDAGGTAEIVLDQVNGIVIPVQTTPTAVADAVEQVRNLPDEVYQQWSQKAVEGWSTRSHADGQYRDFAEHLAQMSYRQN